MRDRRIICKKIKILNFSLLNLISLCYFKDLFQTEIDEMGDVITTFPKVGVISLDYLLLQPLRTLGAHEEGGGEVEFDNPFFYFRFLDNQNQKISP